MVGSPAHSKPVSHSVGKNQIVLHLINLKKTIKTSPLNHQVLNLKKKLLPQRPPRKLVRKDGIRLQKITQNHKTIKIKNLKITQL